MRSYTFVALCITGLARPAAPQTIDPSTVDDATKGETHDPDGDRRPFTDGP